MQLTKLNSILFLLLLLPFLLNAQNGFSGLTQTQTGHYLTVLDYKAHQVGPRLALVEIGKDQRDITIINHIALAFGSMSDLEAICALPGKKDHFLLAESGNWQEKPGCLFHIKVNFKTLQATIIKTYYLPAFKYKDRCQQGDEIEGIEALQLNNEEILILLGERGGSAPYPTGVVRWATLNLTEQKLSWSCAGKTGQTFNAPGTWQDSTKNRDISDLYLDKNNVLWASAAEEDSLGNSLNSIVYKLGTVDSNNPIIITPEPNPTVYAIIKKRKIEGLAQGIEGDHFMVSFEDENKPGEIEMVK